jgi:hypothetical protein
MHNEELRDLYSSPSIIRIIKSGWIKWAGLVARMGRKGTHIGYWWENQSEKRPLGRPRQGGWIILRWILERWDGVVWTGLVWLRIGTGGELL